MSDFISLHSTNFDISILKFNNKWLFAGIHNTTKFNNVCTREHITVDDRDNTLLYAEAGVRTPNILLIHIKKWMKVWQKKFNDVFAACAKLVYNLPRVITKEIHTVYMKANTHCKAL